MYLALRTIVVALILPLIISACGGGGGGSPDPISQPSPNPQPNPKPEPSSEIERRIQLHPSSVSVNELQNNYTDYVLHLYEGNDQLANMSPSVAQSFSKMVFGDELVVPVFPVDEVWGGEPKGIQKFQEGTPHSPAVLSRTMSRFLIDRLKQKAVNKNERKGVGAFSVSSMDGTFNCPNGGFIEVDGELTDGLGNLYLEFNECRVDPAFGMATGNGAISYAGYWGEEVIAGAVYYNQVSISVRNSEDFELSGFYSFEFTGFHYDPFRQIVEYNLLAKYSDSGKELIDQTVNEFAFYDFSETWRVSGRLYSSDHGYVEISTPSSLDFDDFLSQGTLAFRGQDSVKASLEFDRRLVRFLIDQNGDGSADAGRYFDDVVAFMKADIASLEFLDIVDLGYPPEVDPPTLASFDPTATVTVEVRAGEYSDQDTPELDLHVDFIWTINGAVVEPETSYTLAPGMALGGDVVEVVMIVSDGQYATYSEPLRFTISDSPPALSVTGLTEQLNGEEALEFHATVSDPDEPHIVPTPAKIMHGPNGMEIDGQGRVTWDPGTLLFPVSEVSIGLASEAHESIGIQNYSLKLDLENARMPYSLSEIVVPAQNESILFLDVTGDGERELVLTDNQDTVIAIQRSIDGYKPVWTHPFAPKSGGRIVGMYAPSSSGLEDGEIIVITEKGFEVVGQRASSLRILYQTDIPITAATVAKKPGDDEILIAVTRGFSGGPDELVVFSMRSESVVFTSNLHASVSDIGFGNVDADSQLELVINSGEVYDTQSWEKSWSYDDSFGDSLIALGDIDGDRVDEIFGADRWGQVSVFSAIEKELKYSFENGENCSLAVGNVDSDEANELIVGNCQNGFVAAYSWISNSLQEDWSIDNQGSGAKSILVADVNEDGQNEVTWSSSYGTTSAGRLLIAELSPEVSISDDSITTNPRGWFATAGWTAEDGMDKALFLAPKRTTEGLAQVSLTIGPEEEHIYSEETLGLRMVASRGKVVDYDSDGLDDLFMTLEEPSSLSFAAVEVENLAIHHVLGDEYGPGSGNFETIDLNDDQLMDLMYLERGMLKVVDIETRQVLSEIASDLGSFRDFAITEIAPRAYMLAMVSLSGLELWLKEDGNFTKLDSVNINCDFVEFANVDDEPGLEVICLYRSNYLYVVNVVGNRFSDRISHWMPTAYEEMVVDHTNPNYQTILAVSSSFPVGGTSITSISPLTGNKIWQTDGMIGRFDRGSLRLKERSNEGGAEEIMFSTDKAIFYAH